jgi:hypothetical protein
VIEHAWEKIIIQRLLRCAAADDDNDEKQDLEEKGDDFWGRSTADTPTAPAPVTSYEGVINLIAWNGLNLFFWIPVVPKLR